MTEDSSTTSTAADTLGITYVGHATVRIEVAGTSILTDPILRRHVAFLRWKAPPHTASARPDAVLISHLHHDHCDPRSLARLGHDVTLLVPWGNERFFRRRGFRDVIPMRPHDRHTIGTVDVVATEAEHDGRRYPFSRAGAAIGFVVTANGRSAYFAGDTDLFAEMSDLGTPVDVALLPVAGWGRSMGPGHLDPVRAAEAVARIRPAVAVPIHWGALQPFWHRRSSPDGPDTPAAVFAAEVRRRSLPCDVRVLPPGGALTWPA